MAWSRAARLAEASLADALDRLERHPDVTGVLLIGSLGADALTDDSDVDLVVCVAGMPVPVTSALTWIDGRIADIVLVADEPLERAVATGEPPAGTYWRAGIGQWVREGRIRFERDGRLTALRALATRQPAVPEPRYADLHMAWYAGYFGLHQLRRHLHSRDPAVRLHVDLRLGHLAYQAAQFYFMVRGIPWDGSRKALGWLQRHDGPAFELLLACRDERDSARLWSLVRELMDRAMAPLGSWPERHTAVGFARAFELDEAAAERGLRLVEELFAAAAD